MKKDNEKYFENLEINFLKFERMKKIIFDFVI